MGKAMTFEEAPERREWTGAERLGLRISEMINHPVAQIQRWVVIHQLDTDAQADWEGVIGVLAETDGLELVFNDDGTVKVWWEQQESDEPTASEAAEDRKSLWAEDDDAPAPF